MGKKLNNQTTPSLKIKQSINGQGIFAKRKFIKDKRIFEIKGKQFHYTEVSSKGGRFQDNTFRFDEENYLSPEGQIGDFLNHSCEPNAKVVKKNQKLYIYAIKNIDRGSEVVIDYSTILAADDIWQMVCRCGSINCRKKIKKFPLLTKQLQLYYKKTGVVPTYILEIAN